MDRIKRLSYEVLDVHKSKFGEDFADNKKVLDQISIIRSKGLKNEVAGYITKFIKKEVRDEKAKQAQIESLQSEELAEQEVQVDAAESVTPSEETTAEVVDTTESVTPSEETTAEVVDTTESVTPSEETTAEVVDTTESVTPSEETTAEVVETPESVTPSEETTAEVVETPESVTPSEETTAEVVETTEDKATEATEEKTE